MKEIKNRIKRVIALCLLGIIGFSSFNIAPMEVKAEDQYVYDQANLLDHTANLKREIADLRSQLKIDIVIVTTNNARGKSARDYADDFYDDHGFGYDRPRGNGVLFLIDMDNREAYISTCGSAIHYFTDSRIDQALDDIVKALKRQDYDGACEEFLQYTKQYMEHDPYEVPSYGERLITILQRYWGFILLLSIVIAGITVGCMAHSQRNGKVAAGAYLSADKGMRMTKRVDDLISEFTTSREIPKDDDHSSGGSRSGGSSVHSSSSGTTHGGGGRSF